MSEENQLATPVKYTVSIGCSTFIIWVMTEFLPPEKFETTVLLVPLITAILTYMVNILFAYYGKTSEEIDLERKLKRDKKYIEDILDDAKKYPHRYLGQESYLAAYRTDLQETNLQLAKVGRTLIAKKFN